jgi:hypothetical protein
MKSQKINYSEINQGIQEFPDGMRRPLLSLYFVGGLGMSFDENDIV